MEAFEYNASPARVIFGSGTLASLLDELNRHQISAPLILSTPRQAELISKLTAILKDRIAGVFTDAKMRTPLPVTKKAVEYAESINADSVISVGGGSTIGLGKAISIRTGRPHIAIPTTYAGSEMTPIFRETKDGKKTTINDPKVLPTAVIYDADLSMTLPWSTSATSVEALYARNANPIISLLAVEGIKELAESLPKIVNMPLDVESRRSALYGAWLCGTCLGAVGMSLHHKLCYTLGGSFGMPHPEQNGVTVRTRKL